MRTLNLRRLNFRHLQYFWVVAKEEHLTRAAEQLFVSQSALSVQIRKLEEMGLAGSLEEKEPGPMSFAEREVLDRHFSAIALF